MSQIEVSRISSLIAVGAPADNVLVSRISVFFVMKPGEGEPAERQGFCYAQRVAR